MAMLSKTPRRPVWLVVLLLLGYQIAPIAAAPIENRQEFLRGMVVSCPRGGQIWGSPEMSDTLKRVTALGARWVAIHPYAGVRRDGSIRFRPAGETGFLQRAATLAEAAGVHLFWKPHLAYWGSFAWRGDIEFGDDTDAWRRFFDGYRSFIVDQAKFAESVGVDLLAVGVEYEKTTRFELEWRQIIAAVRAVFSGRITYAANWDSLDRVPFWDAVDLIGVHAYFPLSLKDSPDRSEIWHGWDEPLERLAQFSRRWQDKPILFAEIGYPRSRRAAAEPWVPGIQTDPGVLSLRRTLIEVALERIQGAAYVEGMFWWKWIPGDDRWDRDFSMKDEEALQAIQGHWGQTTRSTAQ